jgi:hypothetical protein
LKALKAWHEVVRKYMHIPTSAPSLSKLDGFDKLQDGPKAIDLGIDTRPHTAHTECPQEVQSRSQNRKITVQWQKSTVLAGFDMNVWKVNSEQIMTSTEEVATSCGLSSTHTVQM